MPELNIRVLDNDDASGIENARLVAGGLTARLLLIFPYQTHQKAVIRNYRLVSTWSGYIQIIGFSEPRRGNTDITRIIIMGLSPAYTDIA